MIRTGKIKINGKKKPETYIIEESDEITFWLTDEEIIKLQNKKEVEESVMNNEKSNQKVNNQRLEILYEDDYLMVINKPYGINVHPGDHKTKEISLIECVQDMLGTRYNSLTFKPSLVHRIDRDTSGCILIAKDKSTLESLLADLQSHKIDKIYHAVIRGKPREIK